MKERGLSAQSSVYHYTLLFKIRHSLPLLIGYGLLLGLVTVFDLLTNGVQGALYIAISFSAAFFIQLIISLCIIHYLIPSHLSWRFSWSIPYIGYVPEAGIRESIWTTLHLHITFVGIVALSLVYIWIPRDLFLHMIFMHIWLILPKLYVSFRCRQRKKPHGIIKISKEETAFYLL